MKFVRLLLFPFALLYGCIVMIRNKFYDWGVLKSTGFSIPLIVVGNLEVGGSGKSPMTEYLIRLLSGYKIATLSRGYGRRTKGFLLAGTHTSSLDIGDEPMQFHRKFKDISVAVCEKRVDGVEQLKAGHDVIILDDAFQHRALQAGFSMVLFDYHNLFDWQCMLPTGNLREPLNGKSRADILVVTKCPISLDDKGMEQAIARLDPATHQRVFFSYIKYGELCGVGNDTTLPLASITRDTMVFLLTGIVNVSPLLHKLRNYTDHIIHHKYPDHHTFSTKNIAKLVAAFDADGHSHKVVITTEKDAQRLLAGNLLTGLNVLPLYYLPIVADLFEPGKAEFDKTIIKYVERNKRNG